jgi:hypothetical protein
MANILSENHLFSDQALKLSTDLGLFYTFFPNTLIDIDALLASLEAIEIL